MFGPDGQSIAFVQAPGIVKKIRGDGSTPTEIARLPNARRTGDMTWGPAGILIAVWGQGILRLSPDGGFLPEEPVVSVGPDERVLGPQMLPDGRRVLFTVSKGDGDNLQEQVVVQSLDGGTRTVLREGGSGRYLPTGHLLYAIAGTIYAVAFDAASLESRGSEVPVVPGVRRSPHGVTHLAVSDTGTLVYIPGPANTTIPMFGLALSDGRSNPAELKVAPAAYSHPRVSPDGLRLAVGRNDGRDSDIWTYDLGGKTEIRNLTLDGSSRFPVWSHNSRRITFQSSREGDRGIYWQPVDGGRADRLTKAAEGEEHVPEAWSPDGRHLLFSVTKELKNSLMVFTLDSRKTDAFGGMPSAEPLSASFSEDGRWVAYAFAERAGQRSPKSGIFVEPFPPATGEKRRVPDSFIDFHPVWSPDGKSIFYVQASSQPIVAVPVTRQPTLDFEKPVEILRGPMPTVSQTERRGYDVLKDGRFISLTPAFEGGQSVHVWLNWFEELKRLVPAR
jgi:serine/threonine-protein kinase